MRPFVVYRTTNGCYTHATGRQQRQTQCVKPTTDRQPHKSDMCDQLKDVPDNEWETLKADVRDLKENQQMMLEERATLKGWLRGWLFGIGLFFAFAQAIGGIIIYRAMQVPEENRAAIDTLRENTQRQLSDLLKVIEANNINDQHHHKDSSLHMPDSDKRKEFVPRTELTLTLAAMDQRSSQTRADLDRQFLILKEQLIKLESSNAARTDKLEAQLEKLIDMQLKEHNR